jgi:hypothetical protein
MPDRTATRHNKDGNCLTSSRPGGGFALSMTDKTAICGA